MAYAIASNSVVQLTVRSKLFNQTVINTFHWRWEVGTVPITDGASALDDLEGELEANAWRDSYQAMLAPQCLNGVADLQWIHPTRYQKRSYVFFPAGSNPLDTTVTNLAAALEFRADIATRRAQSTKHIPSVGGLTTVGGLLNNGFLGTMDDFRVVHMLPIALLAGTFRPIIYGRARPAYTDSHGVVHPALPVSTLPITTSESKDTVRVMRRRTVGVGI